MTVRKYEFRGFTLIELLIVVAIIAILAAIAVPNFLEAQVRAKVSRGKTDMRSMATVLEAYQIDWNHYVPDHTTGERLFRPDLVPKLVLFVLTTPVAYMTSVPKSAFVHKDPRTEQPKETPKGAQPDEYFYVGESWTLGGIALVDGAKDNGKRWAFVCWGPDRVWNGGEYLIFGEDVVNQVGVMDSPDVWGVVPYGGSIYDPTNGTVSYGDVVRVGP